MKKVKILQGVQVTDISPVVLEDFTLFEAKVAKIKTLKEMKQIMDKSVIRTAIDTLKLKGKKITVSKVKKICKKAVIEMIEEEKQCV